MNEISISNFTKLEIEFTVGFNKDVRTIINDAIEKSFGFEYVTWSNDNKLILNGINNINNIKISI